MTNQEQDWILIVTKQQCKQTPTRRERLTKGIEEQKQLFVEDQLTDSRISEATRSTKDCSSRLKSRVMQAITVSAQQLDNERQQLADRILREEEQREAEQRKNKLQQQKRLLKRNIRRQRMQYLHQSLRQDAQFKLNTWSRFKL
ncbi:Hypothetical_protein [Hexamita inflata]|uniref:Hypothetical_protein n=1 Tax=Hexamita inflata TaxID=28002 RepID=A0AA86PIK5_9EUKA|nr:Hypothetical protein HINF_LOCUS26803 [Hexamita inflata]